MVAVWYVFFHDVVLFMAGRLDPEAICGGTSMLGAELG